MADNWEVVSGYETNDYTDTVAFEMDEGTKRLKEVSGQALVAGEKNSQYIRFMIPRYWDGIDVSEKDISIVYGLAGKYYGESAVVSVERTDDRMRFGWIVPEGACCVEGTLLFAVIVKDDTYTLKSQIVEKNVFKSINIDDIAPEPTREAWYKEFQARVDQALTNAESTLSEAQDVVAEARAYVGAPLVARTADDFEDTDRIYVYTGSEEGYNAGHWYYWRGTAMAWADGGVYNAVAVDTDTTLSISGKAADAKETGEQITELKSGLSEISSKAFSSTAKVLLISLLKNAVYTSDQTDTIDALDTALNIGDIVAVTGISLDASTKTVTAGDTVTITATITPSNATNKGIVWTSSDETVATVSGGVVTGVGNGTAVITAKTVDGGFTATCSVTSTVVNLLDRSKSSVSNYVKRDNGQLASSDTFDATDFIWLEPNTTYYSEGCYLENFYAFYNANKVYVSSPPASVTITSEPDRNYGAHRKGTIVTGSQGYYFRGSYNKAVAYTPYIALTPIE